MSVSCFWQYLRVIDFKKPNTRVKDISCQIYDVENLTRTSWRENPWYIPRKLFIGISNICYIYITGEDNNLN